MTSSQMKMPFLTMMILYSRLQSVIPATTIVTSLTMLPVSTTTIVHLSPLIPNSSPFVNITTYNHHIRHSISSPSDCQIHHIHHLPPPSNRHLHLRLIVNSFSTVKCKPPTGPDAFQRLASPLRSYRYIIFYCISTLFFLSFIPFVILLGYKAWEGSTL